MATTVRVTVEADGRLRFIYTDALASLLDLGTAEVVRASHVEPAPGGGWLADMRPSGGPVLGSNGSYTPQSPLPMEMFGEVERFVMGAAITPFALRQDALDAEMAWLQRERGL